MSKLCRNKGRKQQVSKSKSSGQEMQQNIILSSNSNKLEFDQGSRVNLLTYWETFEIRCSSAGNTGDFATFVDIFKQSPTHHTEGDVSRREKWHLYFLELLTFLREVPLLSTDAQGTASQSAPTVLNQLTAYSNTSIAHAWASFSMFSPASPWKVFLIQPNTHLWVLQHFTNNLGYTGLLFALYFRL